MSMEYNRKVQVRRRALKETPEVEKPATGWSVHTQLIFQLGLLMAGSECGGLIVHVAKPAPTTHSLVHAAA